MSMMRSEGAARLVGQGISFTLQLLQRLSLFSFHVIGGKTKEERARAEWIRSSSSCCCSSSNRNCCTKCLWTSWAFHNNQNYNYRTGGEEHNLAEKNFSWFLLLMSKCQISLYTYSRKRRKRRKTETGILKSNLSWRTLVWRWTWTSKETGRSELAEPSKVRMASHHWVFKCQKNCIFHEALLYLYLVTSVKKWNQTFCFVFFLLS